MKPFSIAMLTFLMALSATGFATSDDAVTTDPLKAILSGTGLTERDLRPDPVALLTGADEGARPPILTALFADPLKAGYRVGLLESRFRARTDSVHRQFMQTCSMTGADVARGYIGNPFRAIDERLMKADDPLAEAMAISGKLGNAGTSTTLPSMTEFPNPMRLEVARLIAIGADAELFRRRAFNDWPLNMNATLLMRQAIDDNMGDFEEPDYRRAIGKVEINALMAAGLDVAAGMEDFADAMRMQTAPVEGNWEFTTALGRVLIDTRRDGGKHDLSDVFLCVDLHGDDVYTKEKASPAHSIYLIFDGDGNDIYDGGAKSISGAVMGCTVLWDAAGDDEYRGGVLDEAAALCGTALLYDGGGNDRYGVSRCGQAFAICGAALLVDASGDDLYESLSRAQASAGPRGAAVLFDGGGNDIYRLLDKPLVDPSAQLPDQNVSMGQGCGWGLRADLGDGRSLTGGAGLLIDESGDDQYSGSVFCQGAGFLQGVGMLVDGGGKDAYHGDWYAQAAAAHRAGGVLIDRGDGDDKYEATHYTSICAAHDGSVAFLHDEGGNDTYVAENLAIGGAQDNGVAIFVDGAGDDHYEIRQKPGHGLGSAQLSYYGTSREVGGNTALFFDLSGKDTYSLKRGGPQDSARWTGLSQYPELKLAAERGYGLDGEYQNTFYTSARTKVGDAEKKQLEETVKARRAYRSK
ncbi:hypothetical protein BH09SUM1_BH09SUM1_25560 [soil metagenome]